jgi:hypothetical protein
VYASVVYVEMSFIFKTPEKSKFDVHMPVHCKYISKVQPTRCNVFSIYLFPWVALHVSGGSSAHHQEHKTVHTASGIVKPILLPAAIMDETELAWMCSWRRTPPTAHSSYFHLIHNSGRQQYWFDNTWRCMYSFVLLMAGGGTAWNMQSNSWK